MPNRAAINCTFEILYLCVTLSPPLHPPAGLVNPRILGVVALSAIPDGRNAACCWNCMLARACWYWSMPVLNTAVAPLAFSKAARLGRGAMTLGAMPCPARGRGRGASVPGGEKKKKHKSGQKKRCVEERERMCWTEAKRKQKKGKFVREHRMNSKTTSLCVQKQQQQQQQQSHHIIISKQAAVWHKYYTSRAWCFTGATG